MEKFLIIGGTGTLGSTLVAKLYQGNNQITVFSRDELKQAQMRAVFPKVRFVIGDIRCKTSILEASRSKDVILHCAALKRVDDLEFNPEEALKTNVLGTTHAAKAAIENNVPFFAFCSSDKAVKPINVYGYSKALASSILLDLNRKQTVTKFSVFIWTNVLGSRGSVIANFVHSLIKEKTLYITDKRMNRGWLTIDSASEFMLNNYKTAPKDRACIPPTKAADILRVGEAVAKILSINDYKVTFTGIRPGEKIVEDLYTSHSVCLRTDICEQYTDEELIEILEPIVKGMTK
jgi:UDP-N-acetylglucosamine 4,6-dehydratase/5-epimerase